MAAPVITLLPEPRPSRGDNPQVFADLADAVVDAQYDMIPEINTSLSWANDTAADVAADAASAADSAAIAASSANFRGEWSSLTGSLNVPSSVLHSGKFWMLLNNLADVTASEPGVTADWYEIGASGWNHTVSATGKTLESGEYLWLTADSQTATLPASPSAGNRIGLAVGNFTGTTLARNGELIEGDADDFPVNLAGARIVVEYVSAALGWKLVSAVQEKF